MRGASPVREKQVALNRKNARLRWGSQLSRAQFSALGELSKEFGFSIARGELTLIEGRWYVTHTGLIRVARNNHCAGIKVRPVHEFSDPSIQRWAFEATVYKSRTCRGFAGYGDADPSNVSPLVRGAEMRVAETRAVNRALRKAYGIGICSVEEIGSLPSPAGKVQPQSMNENRNGNGNGVGPKVRDRLCQIIRQYKLDPELVKSYAVDFCGTKTLRDASREQVENFVQSLADWAEKDRNALLCQLNSYAGAKPQENVA